VKIKLYSIKSRPVRKTSPYKSYKTNFERGNTTTITRLTKNKREKQNNKKKTVFDKSEVIN